MKKWLMVVGLSTLLSGCNQTPEPSDHVKKEKSTTPSAQETKKSTGPFGFEMGLKLDKLKELKLYDLGKNNQWVTDIAPGDKGVFNLFTLTITQNAGLCEVEASAGDPNDPKSVFDELTQRLTDRYGKSTGRKGRELPTQEGYHQGDYAYEYTWDQNHKSDIARIELSSSVIKGNKTLRIKYRFSNYSACMKEIASRAQL